jgi:pantoate--beta-alanine ligase
VSGNVKIMKIVKTIEKIRKIVARAKSAGKKIGFVPTMGALHEGNFSLIKAAKKQTDFVVVSIFVNPTQFGPGEDLAKYPRPLKKDVNACKKLGVNVIFAPTIKEMYSQENITWVQVEKLSAPLCGKSRQGHFRGVATVCSKLFNIVEPDIVFFGQKDAQQAIIVQRMVSDLNMPLKIVVCRTVRQRDGLAMSSRNVYLKPRERKDAALLYAALQEAQFFIKAGHRKSKMLISQMKKILKISRRVKIDYIEIVDANTLEEIERVQGKVLIALAAKIGKTRLIDNIIVEV